MEGEEEINLFEMDPSKQGRGDGSMEELSLSHDETSNLAGVTSDSSW